MMKILGIQGSPRPKAGSNTEILLQEFLKGPEVQGPKLKRYTSRTKKSIPV